MVSVDVIVNRHERRRLCAELKSCMNREVGLGSHSLSHSSPIPNIVMSQMSQMVSVDVIVNRHERRRLCAELKSCMNREVGLGSHSLSHSSPIPNIVMTQMSQMVSVDVIVNRHEWWKKKTVCRAQELYEQWGGPGLSFPIPLFPHP